MMLSNRKCDFDHESNLARRFFLYSLFKQYYQGEWRLAGRIIKDTGEYLSEHVSEAFGDSGGFDQVLEQDISRRGEIEFDYNRLFIGPAKLLAPPFESAYRNAGGLLMQQETLAVRDFYHGAGIEVQRKNAIPDDHLGLQLEFICYLLAQAGRKLEKGLAGAEVYIECYRNFFEKHLQQWIYRHCADVEAKAKTPACRGVAAALAGFLQSEEMICLEEGMN